MGLKEDIRKFAKDIGMDAVGFAPAEPFLQEKEILQEKKARGLLSPFEERDIDRRCYPDRLLPGARTIICFAMGYLIDSFEPEETLFPERSPYEKSPKGKISRYARVKDYHGIMGNKLNAVVKFISKIKEGRFKIFIDTGSLLDRAAARRAGIGWIGENTCLFTPELGSWVFLGEILTDIEIEPDEPAKDLCDHCGRCVRACPTGALMAPFQINPYRCLSYITQMRGFIPEEFRKPLGHRIFGCDTCQEACPKNRGVRIPRHREFMPEMPVETNLHKLVIITRNDFEKIFKGIAAGWRGRNVIRRNAACALGNLGGEGSAKVLEELLNDPSEVVREQARWALDRLC
jgi:epoxyqueuosine reductase